RRRRSAGNLYKIQSVKPGQLDQLASGRYDDDHGARFDELLKSLERLFRIAGIRGNDSQSMFPDESRNAIPFTDEKWHRTLRLDQFRHEIGAYAASPHTGDIYILNGVFGYPDLCILSNFNGAVQLLRKFLYELIHHGC